MLNINNLVGLVNDVGVPCHAVLTRHAIQLHCQPNPDDVRNGVSEGPVADLDAHGNLMVVQVWDGMFKTDQDIADYIVTKYRDAMGIDVWWQRFEPTLPYATVK